MVGIDKLQVTSKEFILDDANPDFWGANANRLPGQPPIPELLMDNRGRSVIAKSIYRNTDIAEYTINHYGLQVQFNPSGLFHEYYLTSTGQQFQEAVKLVEADMKREGILCNLHEMKMSRCDLTCQAEMINRPGLYNPVFTLFKGQRARKKGEFEHGYLIGNKQWETVGYDKIEALHYFAAKKKKPKQAFPEVNLLRIENRWLKSKCINRTLPFNKIQTLGEASPGDLASIYKHHLQAKVFNMAASSEQLSLDFNEQGLIFRQLITKHSTIKVAAMVHLMLIADTDIDFALLAFGGFEGYRNFLVNEGAMSRKHSYEIAREAMEALNTKKQFSGSGKLSVADMLDEIRMKFIA